VIAMVPQDKFFRICYGIVACLLILYLANKVSFIFNPLVVVVKVLLLPFVMSMICYYLLRPVVNFYEARRIKKSHSVVILFIFLFGLAALIIILIAPVIQNQINNLVSNLPDIIQSADTQIVKLQENKWVGEYFTNHPVAISSKVAEYANQMASNIGNAFNGMLGFISDVVIILSTVPFIVYYLLKEDHKLPKMIIKLVPDEHNEEAAQILREMDSALSGYIQGKFIISFILGVLVYIGYLIIGLQYSLILTIAVALMNIIPYVGVLIGIVPSLIVAFIDSPSMVFKVIVVVFVAQQIEANFLAPLVMGKKLDIHPLTIILLLVVVGSLSGILGMFIAIPIYAMLKVIVSHLYRIYLLRRLYRKMI
jgi:predicted PurR-regulated permease PerM